MKIYITADIEGVTGVTNWSETGYEHEGYPAACEQMTVEVAAACRGALKAGATEIWVKDANGSGRNILIGKLPEEARLIRAWTDTPLSMVQEIDGSFKALLFIGYHSPAGSDANPLAHTMSGAFNFIRLNGLTASEFLIAAYTAEYYRVPSVFVSGDKGLCDLAIQYNPAIKTVPTKEGRGEASINYHPNVVIKRIEESVEQALRGDLSQCFSSLPNHFTIDFGFKDHYLAKAKSFYPGAQLIDPQTVRFETDDYYEVLRVMHFLT